MRHISLITLSMLSILAVSAAHAAPAKAKKEKYSEAAIEEVDASENDPLESFNRGVFQFNYAVDTAVVRPVTWGYRAVMPEKGRTMVTNAVNNIYSPVVLANSVLQGDGENAPATFWRFVINSTFGLGGLFDAATEIGLKNRTTDLGETFAIYGADSGPYLVLPILGPSNVRDGLGRAGDMAMNPVSYADDWFRYSVGATAVDARSRNFKFIDDTYASSLDPYSTLRSAWTQHRAEAVKRAKAQHKARMSCEKSAAK